jgi:hypothetical protein
VSIQETFSTIRNEELQKYRRRKLKHLSDDDFAIVEELTNQIIVQDIAHTYFLFKRFIG